MKGDAIILTKTEDERMKYIYQLFFLLLLFPYAVTAQKDSSSKRVKPPAVKTLKDSVQKKQVTPSKASVSLQDSIRQDSARKAADSISRIAAPPRIITWENDTLYNKVFDVPYLPVKAEHVFRIDSVRAPQSKDELFYVFVGIFLFLGFIRFIFPKYFQNIFRLFFQTSFRQKQTREQLLQDTLPSLLMNIFFVLVGGFLITLLSLEHHWVKADFWQTLLYCSGLLAGVYIVKYLFLKFAGWVFNVRDAAETYAFIVFLINKILGVVVLPLLLFYAFSDGEISKTLITIILCIIVLMIAYRYIASLSIIRNNLKVSALQFFIYLCAVEMVPLMIIYKVLFNLIMKNN